MDRVNLQVVRESFGKVVYSHKTHEKAAEIEEGKNEKIKWINIVLTTFASSSLIGSLITDQKILLCIGAILSTLTLLFTIFQLSFNPSEQAEKHRYIAKELWYIKEKYINLIADITKEKVDDKSIIERRDNLICELRNIYKFAPQTNSRAYERARKALRVEEESTFSNIEIDQFVPEELRIDK